MENIWTCKNGKKINVKDMTTEHIENCINALEEGRINFIINLGYLEDNDCQIFEEDEEKKNRWIKIFKEELIKRENMKIIKEKYIPKQKVKDFINELKLSGGSNGKDNVENLVRELAIEILEKLLEDE